MCALRSNKTKLSIIIPSCNEGVNTKETICSILEYTKKDFEIIVVNDATLPDLWHELPKGVKVVTNNDRLGRPVSVQKGIDVARYDKFIVLNARMRFNDENWLGRYVEALEKDEMVCATSIFLRPDDKEINENQPRKYGAKVVLLDKESRFKLFNLKWNIEPTENIDVCLGASTATTKKWWSYIHGLKGLGYWGSADANISLKTKMAGGNCRCIKDVEIGNIYRDYQHYPGSEVDVLYNKMYMVYTLLPMKYRYLINELKNKKAYQLALNWYVNTLGYMEKERLYYKNIKKKNILDFVEH